MRYDSANRITDIQHKNSGATVLARFQYAYNGVDVTSRTEPQSERFLRHNPNLLGKSFRQRSNRRGITTILAALADQEALPEAEALSFEERLGLLVDREITARHTHKLKIRLGRAKGP